ncbi:MAG: DUF5110 domain-containing protein [Polyangiaceae bacterium]|nr:DUF5110 domain-containing protein [Polyangiaceae bacterium]
MRSGRRWALFGAGALLWAGCDSQTGTGGGGMGGDGTGGLQSTSTTPVPTCLGKDVQIGNADPENAARTVIACGEHTLALELVQTGIVRLTWNAQGSERSSFAVLPSKETPLLPIIGKVDGERVLCTPEGAIFVAESNCHLRAQNAQGQTVLESPESGSFEQLGSEVVLTYSADPNEHYYGFGEKTGSLDKKGNELVMFNTDAYDAAFGGYPPEADPLYASIPFFVVLRNGSAHGLFIDNTHHLTFDMAKTAADKWQVRAQGGGADHYLMFGPQIAEVVKRYTGLTGRIPMPPSWSLGFHQSRWGYSPDTKVLQIAAELRSRNIPADGLWLDIQHMDGFRSFTWDPLTFPDPSALTSSLAAQGFHTVAIVDPGIKVDPNWDVYTTGVAEGYFLKDESGEPYVGEVWPGPSVFPDFSNPAVRDYWGELLPRTLDEGVSGLWIDMNEPSNFTGEKGGTVPNSLTCHGDGISTTMAEMHNVYAAYEAKATFEGMIAHNPSERPFVLTRAGYAGVQRYAAMWTGDAPSSWQTLQTTLPMLLGMGLSGLTFSGSDVGGYSGFATPELYARWIQLGSISPFFRSHVTSGVNDQEPWQFGIEVTDVSRAAIEERYRLMPYLYSLFYQASQTGEPVLRPTVYEFQGDVQTYALDDQALLGSFLLIAPVLTEGATTRSLYLPPGRWFEVNSGAVTEGPTQVNIETVLGGLPTFVREGAILPRRELVQYQGQQAITDLTVDVYPSETLSTFVLYEDDEHSMGDGPYKKTTFTLQRSSTGATLTAETEGSWVVPPREVWVRVHRVDHVPTAVLQGGMSLNSVSTVEGLNGNPGSYFYDERDLSILVHVGNENAFNLEFSYDPALSAPSPDVLIQLEVDVPAGTPATPAIHFASSANGWTHEPLPWMSSTKAGGLVSVPRGKYFFYKFTRGDWSTVEKYPGCVEANNRYAMGAAHPVKRDTVWQWADACP